METYTLLREIADSWVLLAMFVMFLGVGVWSFWPSERGAREDASQIPFRNDTNTCDKDCDGCACGAEFVKEPHNG